MSREHFDYLESEWFQRSDARKAFANFQKWRDETLKDKLRHHDEVDDDDDDGISDFDTWNRDEFDYLLGFYGILEIACMIGFVNDIPEEFVRQHLPILRHPSVRYYYEWAYPVQLPVRFRERLMQLTARPVADEPNLVPRFYNFLEVTRFLERDKDMESFLWALDGGGRKDNGGVCNIDSICRKMKKPEDFFHAIQTPPAKRTELQRALNGFYKYIQFCEQLDLLLEQIKDFPSVAEAMWLYHAYWFYQFNAMVGNRLESIIQSFRKWKMEKGGAKALRVRIKEIESILGKLSVSPLALNKAVPPRRSTRTKVNR